MHRVLRKAQQKLRNCATEPEVKDLIYFLKKSGCKINWIGDRGLNITGVVDLKPIKYNVIFDRIEAGTYIIAAALTQGKLKINNIDPKVILTEINILRKMGANIINKKNTFANKLF